jgi:hypothetical protein
MSALPKTKMNADEFLAWAEGREERLELHDGAVVAMYLILDPERRVAIHHKRGQGDIIETRILSEGVVRLDPPGIEAPVAEMFAPA